MNRVVGVAVGIAVITNLVSLGSAGFAASYVPSACRLVTPAEVALVTGRPAPPKSRAERIDGGRGSYCSYDVSGGYLEGGPEGATLVVYSSPLRAGPRFVVGPSRTIAHDSGPTTVVPDGPGTRAELGGEPGFRQLLVRDGRRTLLVDVQVKPGSPVTAGELEAWLRAIANAALA